MAACTIVSGFIDLSSYDSTARRPAQFYLDHGKEWLALPQPKILFIESKWLSCIPPAPHLHLIPFEKKELELWPDREAILKCELTYKRNKEKDTHDFHMVQHQKFPWCRRAAQLNPFQTPYFMWLDFGNAYTLQYVNLSTCVTYMMQALDFVMKPGVIRIPGCWPLLEKPLDSARGLDTELTWYFCGSLFVGDAAAIGAATCKQGEIVKQYLDAQKFTWEVTTWASICSVSPALFDWYQADHGLQMYLHFPITTYAKTLLEDARKLRIHGRNAEAHHLLKQMHVPPFPLASKASSLERKMWYELAIISWYMHEQEQGFRFVNQLLLHRLESPDIKVLMRRNLLFYISPLSKYCPCSVPLVLGESALRVSDKWHVTNPSILAFSTEATSDGYLVTCRRVNYRRDPETHRFSFLGGATKFQSETFLLVLNADFSMISCKKIIAPRYHSTKCNAEGIEDARLFMQGDCVWVACTFPDASDHKVTRTGLIRLGPLEKLVVKPSLFDSLMGEELEAEASYTLAGPQATRHEKNWIPFVCNGEIRSIYSWDPLVVLKPDLATPDKDQDVGLKWEVFHSCPQISATRCEWDLSRVRGGTCGIPWPPGSTSHLLFLVHEVDEKFHYFHRFVILHPVDSKVVGVSLPFYFEAPQIEYAAGLTHTKDTILISYGVGDAQAHLVEIKVADLKIFLQGASPL